MDMIERVAKAMFNHDYSHLDKAERDNDIWIVKRVEYLIKAQVAIEAMREPTEEMVLACVERGMPDVVTAEDSGPIVPALIWQAMIDTALKREDVK